MSIIVGSSNDSASEGSYEHTMDYFCIEKYDRSSPLLQSALYLSLYLYITLKLLYLYNYFLK